MPIRRNRNVTWPTLISSSGSNLYLCLIIYNDTLTFTALFPPCDASITPQIDLQHYDSQQIHLANLVCTTVIYKVVNHKSTSSLDWNSRRSRKDMMTATCTKKRASTCEVIPKGNLLSYLFITMYFKKFKAIRLHGGELWSSFVWSVKIQSLWFIL